MAELTTLTTAWAVFGPLGTAAISAWWLRRNQVKDREHEHALELQRLDRADAAKKLDHQRAVRAERYSEIKDALATFMAGSLEFIRKTSQWMAEPTEDNRQAASQTNDTFGYNFQVVTLLGDEQLSEAAQVLWNETLGVPRSYKNPMDAAYIQKIEACKQARAEFNKHARRYLRSLDVEAA